MKFLITLIVALLPLGLPAKGVRAFVSGERYQIRCLLWPEGCLRQSAEQPEALTYDPTGAADDWWRITQRADGGFSIVHEASGRVLAYDGRRTNLRRYVLLTKEVATTDARAAWNIYATRQGIAFQSLKATDHYLDVRFNTFITGTYAPRSSTLNANERFFLTDRRGRRVESIGGHPVAFAPPAGPSGSNRLQFSPEPPAPAGKAQRKKRKPQAAAPEPKRAAPERQQAAAEPQAPAAKPGRTKKERAAKPAVPSALPRVDLTAQRLQQSAFADGTFAFTAAGKKGRNVAQGAAGVRIRGAYTTMLPKKSYAVKLRRPEGGKRNESVAGLRTDNYWILDAMGVDRMRMRQRVGMDLWNDFATRPAGLSRHALTGTRGTFVELTLNGRYAGLYHLMERTDRKQLDLARPDEKGVHGVLYKSGNWGRWENFGYDNYTNRLAGTKAPAYNNASAHYAGWESKYPDPEEDNATDWRPLSRALTFVATASDAEFAAGLEAHFDLEAVADYWLFMELVFAVDNTGKNMLWGCVDAQADAPRLFPCPWDLDGTFGGSWDGSSLPFAAKADYRQWLRSEHKQNGLFERLHALPDWHDRLARRYRALRATHFSPARLKARFTGYYDRLAAAGAYEREAGVNATGSGGALAFKREVDYICGWIDSRVETLDGAYGVNR